MRRHAGLAAAFVVVHLWLLWATRTAPNQPLYDVPHVYLPWVEHGLARGHWVGITSPWVYPIGALVPMLVVAALGLHHYGMEWLAVVTVLNAAACVGLARAGRRGRVAAYWWLLFLAALGPVAIGRLDAITVPLAMVAILLLDRRPGVAAALLAVAAWVKVWPAAMVLGIVIASRSRVRILLASGAVSAVVLGVAILLGASPRTLTGFLTKQSGRGLQLESPAAMPWLWLKGLGRSQVQVVWRPGIKTFEVVGHGTTLLAHALTPAMLLIVAVVCAYGIRASRLSRRAAAVLGPLTLALTCALIVTDKVGSPQYESWIAAPIVLGLLQHPRGGPSFRVPAVLGVLLAGLTQLIYPWGYLGLEAADFSSLLMITARNGGLVLLLGIAIAQLVRAAAPRTALDPEAGRASVAVADESRV